MTELSVLVMDYAHYWVSISNLISLSSHESGLLCHDPVIVLLPVTGKYFNFDKSDRPEGKEMKSLESGDPSHPDCDR